MYIFQSFKDSFKIATKGYRVWLKYFWWLITFYLFVHLCYTFYSSVLGHASKGFNLILFALFAVVSTGINFSMILSMRSSETKKSLGYFWSYKSYFISFALGSFLFFPFKILEKIIIAFFRASIVKQVGGTSPFYFHFLIILKKVTLSALLFYPVTVFFLLFLLDSKDGFKSIISSFSRAVKMAFYHYPFCFSISVFWVLLTYALRFLIAELQFYFFCRNLFIYKSGISGVIPNYFILLLFPFFCAFFVNLYSKRIKK